MDRKGGAVYHDQIRDWSRYLQEALGETSSGESGGINADRSKELKNQKAAKAKRIVMGTDAQLRGVQAARQIDALGRSRWTEF